MPTYIVQQSAYAIAVESQGLGEVAGVALAYIRTTNQSASQMLPSENSELAMLTGWKADIHPLSIDRQLVKRLCGRYRELHDRSNVPHPYEGCTDCALTNQIAELLAPRQQTVASSIFGSPKPTSKGVKAYTKLGMAT